MSFDLYAECKHAEMRDTMVNFLEYFGKCIPNQDEFTDEELADYIIETLRKEGLGTI